MKFRPFILLLGAATFARAQSASFTAPVSAPPPDAVAIRLAGDPGAYVLQTATNLETAWTDEIPLIVAAAGAAETNLPFRDRAALFIRAVAAAGGSAVLFHTLGSSFAPEIDVDEFQLASLLWSWSDGTTSTDYPEAAKDFGSGAERTQSLAIAPAAALAAINLGFDAADGGETTPLSFRDPQNVSAVVFPAPLPALRYFAASYNPLTNVLDFTGCTNLEAVECFNASALRHVVLTNLPNLKRVCLEDADLRELDLSGNPALEDLRGAMNAYAEIRVDRGTGPAVWHWCTRDNPQLTQSFQDAMTNFFALREFYVWNDSQSGHLAPVSTNLVDLQAFNNAYTSADLTDKHTLRICVLSNNQLTNLVIAGCAALQRLDAHANQLGTAVLDALLATLDANAPAIADVDLSSNAELPSDMGYAHYSNLVARGVSVALDWPAMYDDRTNAPGGPDAITFVTTNQHPHMEIRADNGSPTNLLWHWGDGRIDRGTWTADRDFGTPGIRTNYIEVQPPAAVTYFGAAQSTTDQGIRAVYNAANFPALGFLYLYQQGLEELSLAGCANLTQLHLAGNPVAPAVCDQWFLDLDAAVAGPVTDADFYFPAGVPSEASAAARASLAAKGYVLHPL